MVEELMQAFNLDGAGMGNLAAFYYYAYLFMQLPVGLMLDRYNPRYLLTGAILICAGGALLFATTDNLLWAQAGRTLIGIGGAFSAVGTMKLISIWFEPKKFALMSGLMMTMAMLGAIGGEAPLSFAVRELGWRSTIYSSGIAGLVLAGLVYAVIRQRSDVKSQKIDGKEFISSFLELLKNKQSWLISMYSGLAFAPVSAFAGLWGIPYLMVKYNLSRELIASLVSLSFIGFGFGSPLAGWLSDRIGRRKPLMIIGTTCSFIFLSAVIYLPMNLPLLGVSLTLFGFFSGFFFVSFASIREINKSSLSGTSIGFINMFDALLGALAEPLIGKLLDLNWDHKLVHGAHIFSSENYQHALIALPIGLLIALTVQIFVKETYCQPID